VSVRIGVDVGGTFTDLVLLDERSGKIVVGKTRSVRSAPEQGVLEVLRTTVTTAVAGRAELFLHGSTVGLNALLERRGSPVGLLTTRGFRDVLELRRGDRGSLYDVAWQAPDPLVPRRLRLPVDERIASDGSVLQPLDVEDVRRAAAVLAEAGVAAVAVVFINSYSNPAHELEAEKVLRAAGFEGTISLSHRLSGEYKEFERSSTTVVDAYIKPTVSAYLAGLEAGVRDTSPEAECLITRSGGGMLTFAEAEGRPFETIMSGPVAGAVGAAHLCRQLDVSRAITADVGGTSFDTCLISDGQPNLKFEGDIDGLPIQSPWVDVRSIGAGGGSIAFRDLAGRLRVGPRSAGADPGPVCYRRGGTEPTLTDAAAALGMLGDGRLADSLVLDVEGAKSALSTLARSFEMTTEALARGVLTIAVAAMGGAIRSVTIERGEDPREAHLIAFGGAGPLLATLLAQELDIPRVLIPPHAGNFSALGLLVQDVVRSNARTRIRRVQAGELEAVANDLHELFATLGNHDQAIQDGEAVEETSLDMRYVGQEHTINVGVPWNPERGIGLQVDQLRARFAQQYKRVFGVALDQDVEIVTVRAARRQRIAANGRGTSSSVSNPGVTSETEAFSFSQERWQPFALIERSNLASGSRLQGPAIIAEPTTTTYLDAGFKANVTDGGVIVIDRV
jgi:N-methylhydantoinase A